MEGSFFKHYIPEKVAVNKDVVYNESNIVQIVANVQDYVKLIEEVDKYLNANSVQNTQVWDKRTDILVNKDIEKLKIEMRSKLEQFKKDNYINQNFYTSMKNENKLNSSFDETIKKMADEIIKVVNTQGIGTKESTTKKKK